MIAKISKSILMLCCLSVFFLVGCQQKDSEIQSQLNEKLASSSDLNGVSATVSKGEVTLSGKVPTEGARTQAETAAKEVKGVKSVVNNTEVYEAPPPPPPVVTVPDSTLTKGVADATKDFPTVTATVNQGEITLTGKIKRDDLDRLMQSLNTLNATKINNQLTIE